MENAEEGSRRPLFGKKLDLLFKSLSRAFDIVLEKNEGELSLNKVNSDDRNRLVKELKVYLCVGINDVTRALERMPVKPVVMSSEERQPKSSKIVDNANAELGTLGQELHPKTPDHTQLQAVIVAVDVHPRMLISHVGVLCASRGVPMLPVSGGDGCGSLRLGGILGTRTAIAVGIKAGDTAINWAIESFLESRTN